jgi:hypothetical protein
VTTEIPSVPSDECLVYRLIKPEWVTPDGSRPKSQAFSDHRDDGALSVFLSDEMDAEGKTVADLRKLMPGYSVCGASVAEFRALRQTITRDPTDLFPGHAAVRDVTGKRSGGTRSKLAKVVRWYE